MSWLRFSDDVLDWPQLQSVSAEAFKAYVALVGATSRAQAWDGRLARRRALAAILAYDDAPQARLEELCAVGLVTDDGTTVTVVRADEHLPPPGVRQNAEKSKVRMRRKRAHDTGDHTLCLPENCPAAPVTARITDPVTRNPGTGRGSSSSHLPYIHTTTKAPPAQRAVS